MAQNHLLRRYLDAGLEFTSMTQSRAEDLVRDLVKAGEVQADQARDLVVDLLERSRMNSERLIETIRTEVRNQITSMGLASHEDIDRVERRLSSLLGTSGSPTAKKAPAKKAPAKKAPAKKAPAKTVAATKPPLKD